MSSSNGSHPAPPDDRGDASRERAAAVQRARLLTAAADALEQHGYARMSVAEVVGRAGVSRKTFYETFSDREDCFLALFEETIAEAGALLGAEYAKARDWRVGLREALACLLTLMDSEPALARLWVLESLRAGELVLQRRARVLEQLAGVLRAGGSARKAGAGAPDTLAVGLVGGAVEVVRARLQSSPDAGLTDLLGALMYMLVLPYLGERAARAELDRPPLAAVKRRPRRSPMSSPDPLEGLRMRLTYRTIRVLLAIGREPRASNREVAQAAGIADQGQVSKLLRRLAGLELIANQGSGEKGAPNAWLLTLRGEQLLQATTTHRHRATLLAAAPPMS